MKKIPMIMTAIAASAMMMISGPVLAADGADLTAAKTYLKSRMEDPDRADFRQESAPYRVQARLGGKTRDCWAMDVHVRTSLSGPQRGVDTYTVLFYEGRAVALARDIGKRYVTVLPAERYAAQ